MSLLGTQVFANPNTPLWLPADTPVNPPPTEWLQAGSYTTILTPGDPIDWIGQGGSGSVYPTTPGKFYQITILGATDNPIGTASPNDVARVRVSLQNQQTNPVFPFPPIECWTQDIRLNTTGPDTFYTFTTVLTCKIASVLNIGIEFVPFTGTTGTYVHAFRSILITELS